MDNRLTTKAMLFEWFHEINFHYFNNSLKPPKDIKFEDIGEYDGMYRQAPEGDYVILLHIDFKRHQKVSRLVLTHEIVHQYLEQQNYKLHHGMHFDFEIVRLINAGAYNNLL